MATATIHDDTLLVELSRTERILTMHGSLAIPLEHVRGVSRDHVRYPWFTALRVGAAIPFVRIAGSLWNADGWVFYDYRDPDACVTFDLQDEHFHALVVQIDDPQRRAAIVAEVERRIAARGVPAPA
jgi:hypothetical protein